MKLTEIDQHILKSYGTLLDGLAGYLGEGCEIVLHSLENLDRSVIKIVNGHHTGRTVGAPITNLALEMLDEIQKDPSRTSISYFTNNKKGEPLKSATIAIRGENERIIGLLCMNFYLNMQGYDYSHPLWVGISSEFVYELMLLILLALFVGHCYTQKYFLYGEKDEGNN